MWDCIPLVKTPDAGDIVRIINDAIPSLGCSRHNFCLLLTDAATYMTCAGKTLHVLYPQLFHVTCTAHLLHNCALRVRAHFDNVDALIARVKAACVKNSTRRSLFDAIGQPPTLIGRVGLMQLRTMLTGSRKYVPYLMA